MRTSRFSIPLAGIALLFRLSTAFAGDGGVPGADSSAGPAITGFHDDTILAWAGESGLDVHAVYYATYDGNWSNPKLIPGATTMTAPALASVQATLYLAATPADSDGKIVLYESSGTGFESLGRQLCAGNTCAQTHAAPALAGSGTRLYAAWTTPAGTIMYATNVNGVWDISATPVPNAHTSPTAGPSLSVFNDRLYVAWVSSSGETVEVASATLPLTSGSWTSAAVTVTAHTKVAPGLGVLYGAGTLGGDALYLAWTSAQSTLEFAYLDDQTQQWVATNPPVPLPPGPLTSLSPALSSHPEPPVNGEAVILNSVAYTDLLPSDGLHDIHVKFRQRLQVPP